MSFLKRRRNFIFKLIVGIPILLFACIGVLTVFGSGGTGDGSNPRFNVKRVVDLPVQDAGGIERPKRDVEDNSNMLKHEKGEHHNNDFEGHDRIPNKLEHQQKRTTYKVDPQAPGKQYF